MLKRNIPYSIKLKINLIFSFILSILVINSSLLLASAPEFNVVTLKGETQVKRATGKDWENIKSGDKLFADDQIKIGNGAYLALLHSSGSPLEINKSGNYTVKKLASQATTQKSDVTKKFTKYLVEELKGSDDVLASGDYRKKMKNLGAVERAMDKGTEGKIFGNLPLNTYSIDKTVDFSWYAVDNTSEYKFNIKDSDGKVVFEKTVNTTNIQVNTGSLNLKSDECYFWNVTANGKTSEDYCLYNFSTNETASIINDLKTIDQEIGADNEAMLSLVKASYYADKNINYKANEEFKKALAISDNPNYRVIYAKFLVKLGLNQEAEKLINN